MEDLTKTQLILLALLVSFVTSMATGIVAVTLMEQAPEPVVQTINRIVERTVETVREAVPVSEKSQRQATTNTIKETTVVVKEEDLITSTIAKNSATLVRISARLGVAREDEFVGLGVVVGESGIVATDAALLPPAPSALRATLSDGTSYSLIAFPGTGDTGIALLKLSETATSSESVPTPDRKFAAAVFADATALKLGQTVIALGGARRTSVAIGIISALVTDENQNGVSGENETAAGGTTPVRPVAPAVERIETTLTTGDMLPGTPVFNIFGEFVALAVTSPSGPDTREYIAGEGLARLLAAVSPAVPRSLDRR
ncbi:MAG: trypsin-like peptidase domain-containing protein [bacterium]|nr:trypsin-like peptidase domain-containing protein [bacterium]MDZ4284396.1 trypsin-like peptidase domain-containing protein [Patescibacteria group bacterium]